MYFGKHILDSLEGQFRYTDIYIRNMVRIRSKRISSISAILDIVYSTLLSILLFAVVECLIYIFFGSLPIYAFSAFYSQLRPDLLQPYDTSAKKGLYLVATLFCILFELFVQCAVFYKLVIGYYHTVKNTTALSYFGSFLFYAFCISAGIVLHRLSIDIIADGLDLISIKTVLGKTILGGIVVFLTAILVLEFKEVHKQIKQKKRVSFVLLLYISMIVISIWMFLIWFEIDFGAPLVLYMEALFKRGLREKTTC